MQEKMRGQIGGQMQKKDQVSSLWDLVGNTPLIKIHSLSHLTGCEIFAKAEFLNPAGSIKDRTAKNIILNAEKKGWLKPGGTVVEGTAGNTGIALATLANERGYKTIISIANNQAEEKFQTLRALGAEIRAVPPCPFANPAHFYHQAKAIAESIPNAYWANQFENTANFEAHYGSTGPEMWQQADERIDVLTLSVGTGGTLAGTSSFLKEKNPKMQVVVADPYGSGIFDLIKNGTLASEGSSVTEGIGIMRRTANFNLAQIDDAIKISDQQMIEMLFHLAKHDGLLVGPSAALNVRAAFEIAKRSAQKGLRIVTVLCDHASRYQSRLFSKQWLAEKNLDPSVPI